tara:strand:- start:6116 stop:7222 length:1107 start_codon:yes stop_codon:yes gene_type:complete
MKILHLTTCHKFNDHRIFYKHSFAQRKLKHKVKIYAFDSKTINVDNHDINGIKVALFQSKKSLSKFNRISRAFKLCNETIKSKCDLVIIHELELLLICPILRIFGFKNIIFDMHEDFPLLFKSRSSNAIFGLIGEKAITLFIKLISFSIKSKITVNRSIFKKYCTEDDLVLPNYPTIHHLPKLEKFDSLAPLKISYIGVISSNKGADLFIPIVNQLIKLNICFEFHLCGTPRFCKKFSEDEFNKLISIMNVKFYGEVSFKKTQEVISNTHIGLCFLRDNPHHNIASPTKMFEYAVQKNFILYSNNLKLPDFSKNALGEPCKYNSTDIVKVLKRLLSKSFEHFMNINTQNLSFSSLEKDYERYLQKFII